MRLKQQLRQHKHLTGLISKPALSLMAEPPHEAPRLTSPIALQLNMFVQPSKKDKALKPTGSSSGRAREKYILTHFFGASINQSCPSQWSERSMIYYGYIYLFYFFHCFAGEAGSGSTCAFNACVHHLHTKKAPDVILMGRRCYKRPLF